MADSGNTRPEPKVDPESLVLRAKPRKVVRFKRGLLIGIAAIACIAIFGATWIALGSAALKRPLTESNLYSANSRTKPEALASLPSSYDKVKLGSPLPGDLGPPVVAREKSLGVTPTDASFKPNPEDDQARAERMRRAQEAQRANEAGVFFHIATDSSEAPAATTAAGHEASVVPSGTVPTAVPGNASLDLQKDPNAQGQKLDFLSTKPDKNIYNPHAVQRPVSPYELLSGTIIPASLITGLNSDLPGLIMAQVTENVFDSVTGSTLLIPRGSRLIGTYDSVIAFHQSRALVVWQRIIMPNGTSVQIDNLPATDTAGYAGLKDEVDYHTWALLEGVGMSTLLGVSTQLALNDQSDLMTGIRQSTQDSVNQAGQHITEKTLAVQPMIKIRPGFSLRVLLNKDLVLQPYTG
jgi:type IV secretory pathway VirB10-like protein